MARESGVNVRDPTLSAIMAAIAVKKKHTPREDSRRIFQEALRLHSAGQISEAAASYRRVLELKPDHADANNNLGVLLGNAGQFADALPHYERAIALRPDYAEAHNNLAVALGEVGRVKDAVAHYREAIAIRSDYMEAHNNLAVALSGIGQTNEAITHYERALSLKSSNTEYTAGIHNNLGIALAALGRTPEAIEHYERAVSLNPNFAAALTNLGIALVELGRIEEARKHYDRAVEADPAHVPAHFNRAEIHKFRAGDPALTALEALSQRSDLTPRYRVLAYFALGKALEDASEYGRAFEMWNAANRIRRSQIHYDEAAVLDLFRRTIATYDRDLVSHGGETGDPSTIPIFIVGMPRSGSSLVEQILARHPKVQTGGELENLEMALNVGLRAANPKTGYPECMRSVDDAALLRIGQEYLRSLPALAAGRTRLVDKMPGNFLYSGLLRMVLPNAGIIHSLRGPVDTCVSCYSRNFSSGQLFSYDLAELGRYYRGYAEVMAHWRSVLPAQAMFEISYEDLVNDLEGQTRKLLAHFGLEWDENCLNFQKAERAVRTASAAQVRQPLFRTSIDRWRRYEVWLGPLLAELGRT